MHGISIQAIAKPEPSHENLIINELIREYLVFNNLRETLSVFLPGVYASLLAILIITEIAALHCCG